MAGEAHLASRGRNKHRLAGRDGQVVVSSVQGQRVRHADDDRQTGRQGNGCGLRGHQVQPEIFVGGGGERGSGGNPASDQRLELVTGDRGGGDGLQRRVEAEVQVTEDRTIQSETFPLEQNGKVFWLLHLGEQDAFANRVQGTRWHPDGVASLEFDLVEQGEQGVGVLRVNECAQVGGVDIFAQTDVNGPGAEQVPRLRLAVCGAEVRRRECAIRMGVHRQPLARVEQLHEQLRIRSPAGHVFGAEPPERIRGDGVAKQDAVRGAVLSVVRGAGGEKRHSDWRQPAHTGGRPDPVLWSVRGGGCYPAEGRDALATRVKALGGLIGIEDDRRVGHGHILALPTVADNMTTTTSPHAQASGTYRIGGDLPVVRLGYGTMQLTGPGVWGEPANRASAIAVIRRAVDLGVTLFDTADAYGPYVTDSLIREALHPYADDVVIATKVGFTRQGPDQWIPVGRPEYLRQQVELNLRNLGVARIDLLQLHRIDTKVPVADQIGELADLQSEGKIRHIGLSEVSVKDIVEARETAEIVSVQNMFNLTTRAAQPVLDYATKENIAFIPWFPLATGELAGPGSKLTAIAAEQGRTPSQVALAWLLHRSPVMLPIPGTSSLEHLEENVAAAEIQLSDEEYAALDAIA